jgi:hypothetical protein
MQKPPYWPEFNIEENGTIKTASTIVRVLGDDGVYYDQIIKFLDRNDTVSVVKTLITKVELCKHFYHAPTGLSEIDVVSPTQESEKERIEKTYLSWAKSPSIEVTLNS